MHANGLVLRRPGVLQSVPLKPRTPKSKRTAAVGPPAAAPLTGRRKWCFRIAALLLPVLLLVGVELILRLAGCGFDPHFFKPQKINGENYFVQNDEFSFRFFPRAAARSPGVVRMAARKSPDTIRIFILGESAAMGDPEPAYGPARFMEMQLREKFPGAKFEVVNVAFTAINSHVILPIARECARYDGDFWVVYMGNNEMVGPFGAATVFGRQAAPRPYVRLVTAIETTRLGQLASGLASKIRGEKPIGTSWGGMQMFLNNQIAPDSPLRENVHRNFEKNLEDILRAGARGGAKVVLNTVAVNLKDCEPFASLPGKDGRSAKAEFLAGKRLLAAGNVAEAREQLQRASDDDALPFRTDTVENELIRFAAKKYSATVWLCDAASELGAFNPETICGAETFYEHVHFNFTGAHRLGLLWAQQLEPMIPAGRQRRDGWLTEAECGLRLGLSDWNRVAVWEHMAGRLQQAPFSNQGSNPQRLENLAMQVRTTREKFSAQSVAVAKTNFAAALAQRPDDYFLRENLALFLQATGDIAAAADEWARVHELVPQDYLPFFQRGRMLSQLGDKPAAEVQLRGAVERRPGLTEGWIELGNALATQKKYAEALKSYAVASAQRPQDAQILFRAGKVRALQGDHSAAMENYRAAVKLNPAHWEAHYELGGELDAAGQVLAALQEFSEAVRLNPGFSRAHYNFGVLLAKAGRLNEAQAHFEAALRLEPGYKNAQEDLAKVRLLKSRGGN
jgi:tetratricopeptide (TPR) repeat protein